MDVCRPPRRSPQRTPLFYINLTSIFWIIWCGRRVSVQLLEVGVNNQAYVALYSSQGHSIKSLKAEAVKIKAAGDLTHIESLHHVAREAGYANWDELINQAKDPKRDNFFRGTYQRDDASPALKELYQTFLSDKKLPDSKDSYRRFTIHLWDGYTKLGMDKLDIGSEILTPEAFILNIRNQIEEMGGNGLLPQNMPDLMLQTLIGATRIMLQDSYVNVSNEVRLGYSDVVINIICVLSSYPFEQDTYEMEGEEVIRRIGLFSLMAEMEFMSRNTGLSIEQPSIESIFKEDALISFSLPDEFKAKYIFNKS